MPESLQGPIWSLLCNIKLQLAKEHKLECIMDISHFPCPKYGATYNLCISNIMTENFQYLLTHLTTRSAVYKGNQRGLWHIMQVYALTWG